MKVYFENSHLTPLNVDSPFQSKPMTSQTFDSTCACHIGNICANTFRPDDAHLRQTTGSSLVQVTAFSLWCQAIFRTKADLFWLETKFSKMWIKMENRFLLNIHLKMSPAKCQPVWSGLYELTLGGRDKIFSNVQSSSNVFSWKKDNFIAGFKIEGHINMTSLDQDTEKTSRYLKQWWQSSLFGVRHMAFVCPHWVRNILPLKYLETVQG